MRVVELAILEREAKQREEVLRVGVLSAKHVTSLHDWSQSTPYSHGIQVYPGLLARV